MTRRALSFGNFCGVATVVLSILLQIRQGDINFRLEQSLIVLAGTTGVSFRTVWRVSSQRTCRERPSSTSLGQGAFIGVEMSRKTIILSLSVAAVSGFAATRASAQLLPGNVWPNPTFTAQGVSPDPQYGSEDPNPRPDTWHRGGSDFGISVAPAFCFWNPPAPVAGNTVAPTPATGAPPSGGYVSICDSSTTGYGEWFSDFNPLPAASQLTGTPFSFQYYWQYNSLMPTGKNADNVRVSINWGDAAGNSVGSPSHFDNLVSTNSADLDAWTQVSEFLTPPTDAVTARVTIDSGGGSEVTGNLYVADMSAAAAVPEPASLGLLAGAGLMVLRRRRA
jgi:hypothetical protein